MEQWRCLTSTPSGSTPQGFHEIGNDYLLGVHWDEYNVPYVFRFPLVEID